MLLSIFCLALFAVGSVRPKSRSLSIFTVGSVLLRSQSLLLNEKKQLVCITILPSVSALSLTRCCCQSSVWLFLPWMSALSRLASLLHGPWGFLLTYCGPRLSRQALAPGAQEIDAKDPWCHAHASSCPAGEYPNSGCKWATRLDAWNLLILCEFVCYPRRIALQLRLLLMFPLSVKQGLLPACKGMLALLPRLWQKKKVE